MALLLTKKKNFNVVHEINDEKDRKIDVVKNFDEKTTVFELVSWSYNKNKDLYYRWHLNIPGKFLKKFDKIKFLGRYFNCPKPVNEYLSYQYGDWKKPIITSDKKRYLNKLYYNPPSLIQRIFKFIYNYLRIILRAWKN
jgi:hypothetical protein